MVDDAERASRGGWVFQAGERDPVFNAADLREARSLTLRHLNPEP